VTTDLVPAEGDKNALITDSLELIMPGVSWDATSLQLPDTLPIELWMGGVRYLQVCLEHNELEHRRLLWYWADMMRFGERVYGERAAQAMELGYVTGTMYNVAWIGKVEPSCRREEVSFWTHAPVARMDPPEQKKWLDKTVEYNWTRKQLTQAIENEAAITAGHDPQEVQASRTLRLAASDVAQLPPADWAASIASGLLWELHARVGGEAFGSFLRGLRTRIDDLLKGET